VGTRAVLEVRDRGTWRTSGLVVHLSVNVNGAVKVIGGAAKLAADISHGIEPDGSAAKLPDYQGMIDRSQVPKADGSFTIPAVAEGNYKVQARGLSPDSYIADIRQGGSSVYESGIYVADKTPALVEITVGADGADCRNGGGFAVVFTFCSSIASPDLTDRRSRR
jgi:hypothetical protein